MTDLAQQARERSPFDIYSASFFPREHALHCFACGGAIGTTTCNCASYNLSRDFLASALEWARLDALAFRAAPPGEGRYPEEPTAGMVAAAMAAGLSPHGANVAWRVMRNAAPVLYPENQDAEDFSTLQRLDTVDPDESLPGHNPLREALIMAAHLAPGVTRTGSEAERIADAALPLFEGKEVVRPDREAVARKWAEAANG